MSELLTYDLNGNIKSLKRDAGAVTNFAYTGNRLATITGGNGTYNYDKNGNAVRDGRLGLAINYNRLNLPAKIGNISYTYDAAGNKLRKISCTTTTHYVDGIQYNGNVIDVIQTEAGLARKSGTTYSFEYNLLDHLGNVRYSFNKAATGVINRIQSDDYYPFGMRKSTGNPVSSTNKYLYNGKELQDELGQYDYGARFYDPVIGRWNVVDKLAEHPNQIDKSPYAYAWNNPIKLKDPDGNCPLCPIIYLVAELTTTQIIVGTALAAGGAYIITNGINQYNRNSNYSDQDNASSPQVIVKTVSETNQPSRERILDATKDKGLIYKVPGSATKSGKPYIGRHNKPTPQQTRKSNDGRDRKKAEVIDTYDPSKPGEGAYKEQKAMDDNGGVDNLDNKRREVNEKKMEEEKKKRENNNSGNGNQ